MVGFEPGVKNRRPVMDGRSGVDEHELA